MRMYLTLRSTGFMSPVVQSHRDTRGTGFPTNACYPFCTEMHAPPPEPPAKCVGGVAHFGLLKPAVNI